MKKFLVLTSFLCSSMAFGASLPQFMIGDWFRATRDAQVDTFTITADSKFSQTLYRQVGAEGTNIPYPTSCKYTESGVVNSLDLSSDQTKQPYWDAGKAMPTYTLVFDITKVELVATQLNSASCAAYVEKRNGDIAAGNRYQIVWPFKDLNDKVIIDPMTNGVFTK